MRVTRRTALKMGAGTGGAALLGPAGLQILNLIGETGEAASPYELARPENIVPALCLQCNTQCTLKVKIQNGLAVKLDGNAYSPLNLQPQLGYDTSLADAAKVDGAICSKGQAGIQTQYDPYRLRKVLKRAGPRGSGKWKTISFDQAVAEIVDGGKLFADAGEARDVAGFKDVFVLRDAKAAKAMAADVDNIRAGKMTVANFASAHAANLDTLIDPKHPDFGPKNNQFVFMGGRVAPDREFYAQRFTNGGLGSANWFAHTTICEQAHHVAFQYATAQWVADPVTGQFSWSKDKAINHMKPDYTKSEFVIFWGTGAFEANFGPPSLAPQITQALVDGGLKIAVIDPRLSKTAAKGWWIPVKAGGSADNALAMGMIRWIIENNRYTESFLRPANKAAAVAAKEPSWTNSTWLVNTANGALVRAADVVAGSSKDHFVASVNGVLTEVDPDDATNALVGDLDVTTTANGLNLKTGFTLLKEAAFAQTLDQYAKTSGVGLKTLVNLATEFTSHGRRAAIDFYRGPIKYSNGYYTAQAIILLNALIGNIDHQGGLIAGGGGWDAKGAKPGQPFPMAKLHNGALTPFGVKLTREASGAYEKSTLFAKDGYPAKRPWFPFTSDVYQEIIPAANAGYPYPVKILWLHYGTPAYANPSGHLQIEMLQDTQKIPLFIATDIVIGESSMYADYIFPDLAYLERWGNPLGTSPVTMTKLTKLRQPAVAPVPEIVKVGGEAMPIGMDSLMLAIAQRLGAPGYGKSGFAPGQDFQRPEDLYLKMVANVAWGDQAGDAAADADDAELAVFSRSRRHLPPAVFDAGKWKAAVGDANWRRVVYVLNRGGRFEAAAKAYQGDAIGHPWGKLFNLYVENVGKGRHSITGKQLSGVPISQSLQHFDGTPLVFPAEYDLSLITYKEIFGGQSRTVGNYAGQLALMPENFVVLNSVDAMRLGLSDGDLVKVTSPSFSGEFNVGPGQEVMKVQGKIKTIEGLRPGTVMISSHYGHWAYGSRDVVIDGTTINGEARRAKGLAPNAVMAVDAYLKDLCVTDPIAGDSAFFGTGVRLVKV